MTNFVKQTSGYANLSQGIGVLATEIMSLDLRAYRSNDKKTDIFPYSGSGSSLNTWFTGFSVVNGESVMHFANNIDWGSVYTLIATIVYTKS